jgi:putative hemolysin
MKYKTISSVIMVTLLTACSSTEYAESMPNPKEEVVESRMDIVQNLDAVYCSQNGFSRFNESGKYYTFACKDGSIFRVPK